MTITRELLRALRADIDAALAAVGKKHGVVLNAGNASFTPTSASFKLHAVLADAPKVDPDVEAADAWRALARRFQLEPDWLGKPFVSGGRSFTIVGLLPNRPKRPVLARDSKGKGFVFEPGLVRAILA